ncbi:MAG TPA: extracellular solute-binding protein [Roseiflexaceae bacterium]|nr:extracellular solute-binding protein [Roseiflexaceae bacterium]
MKATKHWLVATALLFSVILAACGGPSGAGTPSSNLPATTAPAADATTAAPATDAPTADPGAAAATVAPSGEAVELRIAWWGSQSRHDRTLKVIELFQQANPNITITSEYGNFPDHWTKLATQAAGGNLPDIVQQDYSRIGEWVSRDLLLPLEPFAQSGALDLSTVAEGQLSGGRVNGKLYGVSLGTNALTVLYDPAKFEAAGVPVPTAAWTWTDFKQAATTIHEKLDIYGVESFTDLEFLKLFLKEQGKWLYNDAGTGLGYEDDALVAQYFQTLLDMQTSGASPSREFELSRGTPSLEEALIVQEQAAMLMVWSNQAVAVAGAASGREFGLVQTPGVTAGTEGLYLKPSMFFSIPSQSKHPEEAAMFIDFFLNSPEANKILAAERGVPIVPGVRQALEAEVPPIQQQVFRYIGELEPIAAPINPPDPAAHAKIIADVYTPLLDRVLYGEISPTDAAAEFRTQVTAALAGQ